MTRDLKVTGVKVTRLNLHKAKKAGVEKINICRLFIEFLLLWSWILELLTMSQPTERINSKKAGIRAAVVLIGLLHKSRKQNRERR